MQCCLKEIENMFFVFPYCVFNINLLPQMPSFNWLRYTHIVIESNVAAYTRGHFFVSVKRIKVKVLNY